RDAIVEVCRRRGAASWSRLPPRELAARRLPSNQSAAAPVAPSPCGNSVTPPTDTPANVNVRTADFLSLAEGNFCTPTGPRVETHACSPYETRLSTLPDAPAIVTISKSFDKAPSDWPVTCITPYGTMPSKRQQHYLHQQQLIYAGSHYVQPVHGVKTNLLKHADLPPKRERSEVSPKRERSEVSQKREQSGLHGTAPTRKRETKETIETKDSLPPHINQSQHKGSDIGEIAKRYGKDMKDLIGRPRRPRPVYIPPINYGDRHVPKNIVTIDTSKARGNTDVIRLVARDLGWREFPVSRRDHNCDVTWHAISFNDQSDLYTGQVNKFPGALEVFHKVGLFRQLMLMKQLFPEEFDFFPRTWMLPQQYHEFSNDVRQMAEKKPKPKPTFIIKPSEGSQGDGIYLIREPQGYTQGMASKSHVAQEYLTNVLLIDGYKFDLRVYVVLKSLDPLEIHICNEGLARFSTMPYENPTNKNLHETYMHLTNYSLNKKSSTFNKSDKEDEGSKRKMTSVFRRMERMGHDTDILWREIESIVCKTLIAVAGELKVEYQGAMPPGKPHPSCFQVLGFDILVMRDLKAILLEVNANPSLSITAEQEVSPGVVEYMPSIKDEEVKRALIRDTFILIAPKNKYTRKRRRKHRRRRQTVEEMEVDPIPSPETRHRNHHRERDITIRFQEDSSTPDRQKSIFAENDKTRHPYVRMETCRVFIEGEGEVTNFDPPPYYQPNGQGDSSHRPVDSSSKDTIFLDSNDRLPSVFAKNKSDKPTEAFMEDDGPTLRPPTEEFSMADSSEEDGDEDEEQSCLKEIFPTLYGETLGDLRLVERLADIFISCMSVRGCLRMGPTAFRMFARKCRLNKKGMTNAAIDILYIDMQRKWEFLNPDRTSGLCFQGFVDACLEIARRRFISSKPAEVLDTLVSYCEENLRTRSLDNSEMSLRERLSPRILRPSRRSVTLFPRRTITSLEEETVQDLYDTTMRRRQKSFMTDINDFMKDMRNRTYIPSTITTLQNANE
ncbi:hypothetical protein BaRGS_00028489, partial [Batillaria attramentaria]